MLTARDAEKIIKTASENNHLLGATIRLTTDFTCETMKDTKQQNGVFKVLKREKI